MHGKRVSMLLSGVNRLAGEDVALQLDIYLGCVRAYRRACAVADRRAVVSAAALGRLRGPI